MSTPENLEDLYADELKDLWSANDQMQRFLQKVLPKASDPKLKEMLESAVEGIGEHTALLKELLEDQGEQTVKEHCKGMEGLVEEARKHILEEGPEPGPVLDAVIITQYQRMTHYGLAGFGTAASFAGTLGLEDHQERLEEAVEDMYDSDEFMTQLAETSVNCQAAEA